MKLSPKFPGSVKPHHVGVYKIKLPNNPYTLWSQWSGIYWGAIRPNAESAIGAPLSSTLNDGNNFTWQGLASKDGK